MKSRTLALIVFAWLVGHVQAQSFIKEAQCFGGVVPGNPTGVTAATLVTGFRGTYFVTAWREACRTDPSQYVLLLNFRASLGTPSPSNPMIQQAEMFYEPSLLVKNPSASGLLDYALFGAVTNINVIVEQSGGPRFDPAGRLQLRFADTGLSSGYVSLTLPPEPGSSASTVTQPFHGNLTDMWWNTAENGTGLSVIHHGGSNQLFIVWYTYTDAGEPLWLVIPGGTWGADLKTFTGSAYKTRGTAYTRPWSVSAFAVGSPLGSVEFRFTAADAMTLTYVFGATTGTKTFTRQRY